MVDRGGDIPLVARFPADASSGSGCPGIRARDDQRGTRFRIGSASAHAAHMVSSPWVTPFRAVRLVYSPCAPVPSAAGYQISYGELTIVAGCSSPA